MLIKTKGIIIKHRDIGENDRIITIISGELGVIEVSVRGIRKAKSVSASSLAGSCQIFCYSEFVLFKGKNNYSLNSADSINQHYEIRQDITKTALASYFCEVLKYISPDEQSAGEYIKLTLLAFQILNKDTPNDKSLDLIKAIFEFKVIAISGYAPNFVACDNCGCYDDEVLQVNFFPDKGYILCDGCLPKHNMDNDIIIPLPNVIFKAMRHILYSDITRLFRFNLSNEAATYLSDITESYLFMYIEQGAIKSLDIYKQLNTNSILN